MKKSTKLAKKLTLSTETLRTLSDTETSWAAGGFDTRESNCPGECGTLAPCTSVVGCGGGGIKTIRGPF